MSSIGAFGGTFAALMLTQARTYGVGFVAVLATLSAAFHAFFGLWQSEQAATLAEGGGADYKPAALTGIETAVERSRSILERFYTTPRGVRILTAGIHKALKRIALSQRSIEIRFVVPLEDWPDVSTAWAVELQGLSDRLLPGGTAWGKVTSVEISHEGLRDFPKAVVTMTAVDGGGLPGPDQITGVNPTGELWDGVLLDNPLGTLVPPSPLPAVAVTVENPPGDQVAYVQARDWTGAPGRNDRTLNDPHHLLTEARTKLKIAGVPIAGQPAIVTEIPLGCSAWSGPAQIQIPTV